MTIKLRGRVAAGAVTVVTCVVATAAGCGSSAPALPRAQEFQGARCQAVAQPTLTVAHAVRTLQHHPADAGSMVAIRSAQTSLRSLPAATIAELPQADQLSTDIGWFRLRVDTHSADDAALRVLQSSSENVVRNCVPGHTTD